MVLAGELCATATCGTSALLLCTRQNEGEWCVQDCGLNLYLFMLAVSAAPRLLLVGCPDTGMGKVVAGSNSSSVRRTGHACAGASCKLYVRARVGCVTAACDCKCTWHGQALLLLCWPVQRAQHNCLQDTSTKGGRLCISDTGDTGRRVGGIDWLCCVLKERSCCVGACVHRAVLWLADWQASTGHRVSQLACVSCWGFVGVHM